jgi:hypothetical protein
MHRRTRSPRASPLGWLGGIKTVHEVRARHRRDRERDAARETPHEQLLRALAKLTEREREAKTERDEREQRERERDAKAERERDAKSALHTLRNATTIADAQDAKKKTKDSIKVLLTLQQDASLKVIDLKNRAETKRAPSGTENDAQTAFADLASFLEKEQNELNERRDKQQAFADNNPDEIDRNEACRLPRNDIDGLLFAAKQRLPGLKNATLPEITDFKNKTKKKLDELKDASDKEFAARGPDRGGDGTARKELVVEESVEARALRMLGDLKAEFEYAYLSGTDKQKQEAFTLVLRYNELKEAVDKKNTNEMEEILGLPPFTRDNLQQFFERKYENYQDDVNQYVEKAEDCFKATNVYDAHADDTLLRDTLDAKAAFDLMLLTATEKMEKLQNAQNAADVEAVDAQLLAEQDATETVKELSVRVRNKEEQAYSSYKKRTRQLYNDMTDITQDVYGDENFWNEPSARMTELQGQAALVLAHRKSVVNSGSIPLTRATVLVKCAEDAAAIKAEVDAAIKKWQDAAITAQGLGAAVDAAAPVAPTPAKAIRIIHAPGNTHKEVDLLKKLPLVCETAAVKPGDTLALETTAVRFLAKKVDADSITKDKIQEIVRHQDFASDKTHIVLIIAVLHEPDNVPGAFTVTYGGSDIELTTHRRQGHVALVYAPGHDVLVDEDGGFFSCTLIPVQPIVQGSNEITRYDYCAGTSGKRLRAESMYLCHRKVLAFALEERQKQRQRMDSISGHEIDGDFDRVFVTSDIHADLRKFVQILLACELISIGTYSHDAIYANDTNIYEIVWEARWVAPKTLLVICGDLIDGKRKDTIGNYDGTGDVRGSYEFLLHCLLFNLRIQARDKGSDVRFTIGNHDAATVTAYPPYRFPINIQNAKDQYVEQIHFDFAQCASSRHTRFAGDDEFDPLYRGRQQMLLPFYACSPYLMLTMGEIAFAHAGFVNDHGQDVYKKSVEKQILLDKSNLDETNLADFLQQTKEGPFLPTVIDTRRYASGNPCDEHYGHNRFKLVAVGHCVTHQYTNLSPLMKEQCDNDTLGTHGCVLTRDCRGTNGPLIALVDTGMSAAMRIRGDQDLTTQNKSRQVGMLVLDKTQRSGESLGKVNDKYNVYRIRAMSEMRFLLNNGQEPSMLVIGGQTVPLTHKEDGAMEPKYQACLGKWAAPWSEKTRFAPFPHAQGILSTTGTAHTIVEIHNKADGDCLLHALGFYLCASGRWNGTVTELRTKLLENVKNRFAGVDIVDRKRVKTTIFTGDESAVWDTQRESKLEGDTRVDKYILIRSRPGAYLGELEIDAFAREFKRTVCMWSTDEENNVFKTYCSDSSYEAETPIANFDSFVHLRYYDPGIDEANRNKGHFTLLALKVPTQETASSFGRKRARLYV